MNKLEFVSQKKAIKAANPELSNSEINALAKDGSTPTSSKPVLNAKQTIANIKTIDSVEVLSDMAITETRATVLEAIEKRIKAISNN